MKLADLATLVGQPERLVRFLISEGVVPPPEGGRRAASYDERHERAIRRYLALKETGLALKAIKALIDAEREGEMIPIPVAEGVELRLHSSLLSSGTDPKPILEKIAQILGERLTTSEDIPETETDRARSSSQ